MLIIVIQTFDCFHNLELIIVCLIGKVSPFSRLVCLKVCFKVCLRVCLRVCLKVCLNVCLKAHPNALLLSRLRRDLQNIIIRLNTYCDELFGEMTELVELDRNGLNMNRFGSNRQ